MDGSVRVYEENLDSILYSLILGYEDSYYNEICIHKKKIERLRKIIGMQNLQLQRLLIFGNKCRLY